MKTFEGIYERYRLDVYRFVYKLSGYRKDLAEEIVQETFYLAFASFDTFKGNCEIKTWLCQIAKFTYYKFCKAERKNICLSEEPVMEVDFTKTVEQLEMLKHVREVILEMDERTQTVVMYRVYADLKFSEIATLLNLKESTAKVIFSRAKIKIQSTVKERYGYESIL